MSVSWGGGYGDIGGKIAEPSESAVIIVRIYHVRFATFDLFRFIFTTTLGAFLTDFPRAWKYSPPVTPPPSSPRILFIDFVRFSRT